MKAHNRFLKHYGIRRRSGRYPWGSGKDPYQRSQGFFKLYGELKAENYSEVEISRMLGFESTSDLRAAKSSAKLVKRSGDMSRAVAMKERGMSMEAIATKLDVSSATVANYLQPSTRAKTDQLEKTINTLIDQVEEKKYLDVGRGTAAQLGVSDDMRRKAIQILAGEGWVKINTQQKQLGTKNMTPLVILAAPGTEPKDIYANIDKVRPVHGSVSDSTSLMPILDPLKIDTKRVKVRYAEEGGVNADGLIWVRPGVKDLHMGDNSYAQVRIRVGDNHYLKGVAIERDDLPSGVDLVFNTNKSDTGNPLDAMKEMTGDHRNPFGSVVSQYTEEDSKGNRKLTSAMNIVNTDDSWDTWSRNLPSQLLGKQNMSLQKQQLKMTHDLRKEQLQEIKSLEHPAVRKFFLEKFGEESDAATSDLKAAPLPGQKTHVFIPIEKMKDTEVYAPNYPHGSTVSIVRFPLGHISEIPTLTVNNKNAEAVRLIGNKTSSAIGINSNVAERMSGADFDGDTGIVIPNPDGRIKNAKRLKDLEGFDPKTRYPLEGEATKFTTEGGRRMPKSMIQKEMGMVSNLLTDMQLQGADTDEIVRVLKHSMVVIDAHKHSLDYKQSFIDNRIDEIKKKYQKGGASTLLSRASSPVYVPVRRFANKDEGGKINPRTGEYNYVIDERKTKRWKDKDGNEVISHPQEAIDKIHTVKDPDELSSGSPTEKLYSDYIRKTRMLANDARKTILATPNHEYSREARIAYAKEYNELREALRKSNSQAPLERMAQRLADASLKEMQKSNPDMQPKDIRKQGQLLLEEMRTRIGSDKYKIRPTDRQWEAIMAGAISHSMMEDILDKGDTDYIRKLAMPSALNDISDAKRDRAVEMSRRGRTYSEISQTLGISISSVNDIVRGG